MINLQNLQRASPILRKTQFLHQSTLRQFSAGPHRSKTRMFLLSMPVLALPIYYVYLNQTPDQPLSDVLQDIQELTAKAPEAPDTPIAVDMNKNYFITGVCMIPHKEKAYKGGEDAFSCSIDGCMFCLADGVGGWAKKGVDPGLYSKELCSQFKYLYESQMKLLPEDLLAPPENRAGDAKAAVKELDQRRNLVEACKKTMRKAVGTSTFVSMAMNKDEPKIEGVNLGDSGYLILRGKKALFHSPVQQHRFNHPYQCGTNHKLPHAAESFPHPVKDGDLIVMASDGLWDNLSDDQVIKEISECQPITATQAGEVSVGYPIQDETLLFSKCLAHKAHYYSQQRAYNSPFAQGAKEAGKMYLGGKEDDITVMVGKVRLANQAKE